MLRVRYILGWIFWHMRAACWYIALAFRLFFSIGLDRGIHPGNESDMMRHFICPYPRDYRHKRSYPHGTSHNDSSAFTADAEDS